MDIATKARYEADMKRCNTARDKGDWGTVRLMKESIRKIESMESSRPTFEKYKVMSERLDCSVVRAASICKYVGSDATLETEINARQTARLALRSESAIYKLIKTGKLNRPLTVEQALAVE